METLMAKIAFDQSTFAALITVGIQIRGNAIYIGAMFRELPQYPRNNK